MIPRLRETIAVDMDEVIADALGEHLNRYNRDFPPTPADPHFPEPLTAAHLRGRRLWQAAPPDRHAIIDAYLRSDDFFRVLPVMPDAQRVLSRLQSRYDIFIASAAMEVPTSFAAKYDWLAEHFPFIPTSHIVFCGNKSILRADYLIDDNPRQLQLFEDHAGTEHRSHLRNNTEGKEPESIREGILYTSPANINITTHRRVNNWQEIEALFLDTNQLPILATSGCPS